MAISFPKLTTFLALCMLAASCCAAYAESKNPEDYPLRFHIYSRAEHNHYHHGVQEDSRGEGRANLYANGEVHGVDFSFDCPRSVERSAGYETYLAKWKKPGKQIVVLLPIFGKAGKYDSCDFDVDVKPTAYYSRNGEVQTESAEAFKAWMVKHSYDPEHGKNEPVSPDSTGGPTPDTNTSPAVTTPPVH